MAQPTPNDSRRRVNDYRARLRAQGLKPLQLWVPDVRSRTFLEQAHLQSVAVSRSPTAEDDQAFVDAVADWDEA